MKKTYTLILFLIVFAQNKTNAQCTVAIPKYAIVINTTTTIAAIADTFWVCSGDTLNGSGVDNVYYVESGGALDMSGFHKTVYLKAGASINCSGIDDTIYHEAGAIISCSGNHFDSLCTQLVFDYTDAPANGCLPTGVQNFVSNETEIIFQNPVKEKISFRTKNSTSIVIFNAVGKNVLKNNFNSSAKEKVDIDVSSLASGIYFLKLDDVVRKFVKE